MTIRPLIAAALTAGLLVPLAAFAAPEVGKPAPDFKAVAADGSTVELSKLRGKTVVLEWTNHDCPFVVKHYESGNMQATQATAAAHDAVWLQVISSEPGAQGHVSGDKARQLNADRQVKNVANTLLDEKGALGRAYAAQVTPHLYIIDAQGVLQYMGGIDSIATARKADIPKATNYVIEALDAMKAGQPVPNPVTRAYGCTIKYAS
ncbi:MAG: redoxin domain-containing protein [Zoogloeaceae bacterium]|nr:redoxin domain-containing protein [Zoogloeaceae bacterium]